MSSPVVVCSGCDHTVPEHLAIPAIVMEAIDGNTSNLDPENLRATGVQYTCLLCLAIEALAFPPVYMTSERFKQGYEEGFQEARKWYELVLADSDIVERLKEIFAVYASEGNKERLYYEVGRMVGLLVGMSSWPVSDAHQTMRQG